MIARVGGLAVADGGIKMASQTDSTLMGFHGQDLGLPAWDDAGFLVFMDPVSGKKAPSGDLRFMVQTAIGGRQVVIIQCKKSGPMSGNATDKTASPKLIKKDLELLRGCVER